MNWSEFFSMGGYGFYVWGSYLVTLIRDGRRSCVAAAPQEIVASPAES